MSNKDWANLRTEADKPPHTINSFIGGDILVNIQMKWEVSQFNIWTSLRYREPSDNPIPRRKDNGVVDMVYSGPFKNMLLLYWGVVDSGTDSIGDVLLCLSILRVDNATMVYRKPVHTVKF